MTSCSDERMSHPFSTFKSPHGVRFVSESECRKRLRLPSNPTGSGSRTRDSSRDRHRGRFGQGNPRTAGTRTRRHDPPARARGQFGRRRRRGDRRDAFHHPPAHRRPDRPHQRRPDHGDDLLAGRRQVHPIGPGHRRAGARRRQARRPGQRRRPRSQRQCRPPAGVLGRDRQRRQPDRADRAADHAAGAQFHHRGRARRRGRPRLCRRRHRGQGARGADPERHRRDHQEDRGAAERRRRLGRCRAPHLAGDRGDPPGVRQRQRRGGRAEPDHRRDVRQRRLRPRASSSRSATAPAEIDSATKEAEAHGESVAKAGQAVTTFAQKLKSRCAVLLRQGERRPSAASAKSCPAASRSRSRRRAASSPLRSTRFRTKAS